MKVLILMSYGLLLLCLMRHFALKGEVSRIILGAKGLKLNVLRVSKNKKALSRDLFRIYQYVSLQSHSGMPPADLYKTLYKVAETDFMKRTLLNLSAVTSQSHDLRKGIEAIRHHFAFEEGEVFIHLLETQVETGYGLASIQKLDKLMFQKYMSYLKDETTQIKKKYLRGLAIFSLVTTMMLLMPLLYQMFISAKMIFI